MWRCMGCLLVSGLTLRIAGIILAELSACLPMLEAAVAGGAETIRSCRRTKVLIVALLRRVLGRWLFAVVLIWRLLTVLTLGGLIALLRGIGSLLRRVALAVAGLLIPLLAVLVVMA